MNETTPPPDEKDLEEDTITFKRSHLYAVLLPLAFVLGLSVGYLFWGRPGASAVVTPQAVAQAPAAQTTAGAEPTQQIKRYDVPTDDDPSSGPADAPITIIEFSDFQCPYCEKWHTEVWSQIEKTFPGKVRLVYRDFPLDSLHPEALPAAVAANCANQQGAYWEFHDKLFSGEMTLGEAAYKKYAADLKLDTKKFETCLGEEAPKDEVKADFQYASELGVRSTPTFFVNGIPVVGAQPFEVFQDLITKELNGEIPQ